MANETNDCKQVEQMISDELQQKTRQEFALKRKVYPCRKNLDIGFGHPFENEQVDCYRRGTDFAFGYAFAKVPCSKGETMEDVLNRVYSLQGNNIDGSKLFDKQCTLQVGDVIVSGSNIWCVATFGFNLMTDKEYSEWCNTPKRDRAFLPVVSRYEERLFKTI